MSDINPYKPPVASVSAMDGENALKEISIRRVSAGQGLVWIKDGVALYIGAPLPWLAITVLILFVYIALSLVPALSIFSNLLTPVFLGGMMLGAREQVHGEGFKFSHLIAGFQTNTASLLGIGFYYFLGIIIVGVLSVAVLILSGGIDLFAVVAGAGPSVEPDVAELVSRLTIPGLIILAVLGLLVPLMMAIWFSPALVVFKSLRAHIAMGQSIKGCVQNLMPFLVYGLVMMLVYFIGVVFYVFLGSSTLLALYIFLVAPALSASVYVSYQDVFSNDEHDESSWRA